MTRSLPAHHGQGACHVHRSDQVGRQLLRDLMPGHLLEEPLERHTSVVHQHVDAAESLNCLCHGSTRLVDTRDIETYSAHAFATAERGGDLLGTTCSGHDRIPAGERCSDDRGTHPTSRTTRDEPDPHVASLTGARQQTSVRAHEGQHGRTKAILMVPVAVPRGTLTRVSDSSLAIGQRVVVTGLAGSGKSTLALALARKTGLPVIHLDLAFWKPGWVAPSETEWREKQRAVLAGDAWIADGNYHETLDLRIARAETVVVLDLPWWLCSLRALRRGFTMPDQLPEGCPYSALARWRDEWRLAGRIWRTRHVEPAREREVIAKHGQGVAVHVLRSRRSVLDFLDRAHA